MRDDEANRFSAPRRALSGGGRAGGRFRRASGRRPIVRPGFWERRRRRRPGAGPRARRPEGAADEGGAAHRHHSRGACPPITRRRWPLCKARPRRWARPSSSAGWSPNSARTGATKFAAFDLHPAAAASLGQVHRATTLQGGDVACKLQYPDMASAVEADLAQLDIAAVAASPARSGDRRRAKPRRRSRSALREELDYRREANHAALYRLMLAEQPRSPRARRPCKPVHRAAADARLARRRARLLDLRRRAGGGAQRGRAAAIFHGLVVAFRAIMASSTAIPISAITRFFAKAARPRGSTCSITAASASFPPAFRRRRRPTLSGPAAANNRDAGRAGLSRSGASSGLTRDLIEVLTHLGALHPRAPARRPRPHHRRRRLRRRLWPARGRAGPSAIAGKGAGADSARIRVHGSRGHRPRRRFPASGGAAEFSPAVRSGAGGFRRSRRLRRARATFWPQAGLEARSASDANSAREDALDDDIP